MRRIHVGSIGGRPRRLKCVRDNQCHPYGTRARFPLYPGLTPWANIFRRFAAGVWKILLDRQPQILVLTHTQ